MKRKLFNFYSLGFAVLILVTSLTLITKNSTSKPPTAVYYYHVTISNESSIPSNASGTVRVSDNAGNMWTTPYIHGTSSYNIEAAWINGSTVTACPSLSLNVPVNTLGNICKTFSNPIQYCIGNLQISIGGSEN